MTARERRLVARLNTPVKVQAWLNALPYNTEPGGATLRTFRGVVREGTAHCLEAALFAAVVLEQHGYPPLVMSLESQDNLDHVMHVYQWRGRWGSVARSRDPGLHGRKATFATARALAASYIEPYIDGHGRVLGYGVCDLSTTMGRYEWRLAEGNVWKVERVLIDWPHLRLPSSTARYHVMKQRYIDYLAAHGGQKPTYYDRSTWRPIPREFMRRPTRLSRSRSRAAV